MLLLLLLRSLVCVSLDSGRLSNACPPGGAVVESRYVHIVHSAPGRLHGHIKKVRARKNQNISKSIMRAMETAVIRTGPAARLAKKPRAALTRPLHAKPAQRAPRNALHSVHGRP